MSSSAELNTSNYKVDDSTADHFQNITTFVKNMLVKDSKKYETGENELSLYFSEILNDYIAGNLTEGRIEEFISTVKSYNEIVKASIKGDTANDAIHNFKASCWGLDSKQPFQKSIVRNISNALISDSEFLKKDIVKIKKYYNSEDIQSLFDAFVFIKYFLIADTSSELKPLKLKPGGSSYYYGDSEVFEFEKNYLKAKKKEDIGILFGNIINGLSEILFSTKDENDSIITFLIKNDNNNYTIQLVDEYFELEDGEKYTLTIGTANSEDSKVYTWKSNIAAFKGDGNTIVQLADVTKVHKAHFINNEYIAGAEEYIKLLNGSTFYLLSSPLDTENKFFYYDKKEYVYKVEGTANIYRAEDLRTGLVISNENTYYIYIKSEDLKYFDKDGNKDCLYTVPTDFVAMKSDNTSSEEVRKKLDININELELKDKFSKFKKLVSNITSDIKEDPDDSNDIINDFKGYSRIDMLNQDIKTLKNALLYKELIFLKSEGDTLADKETKYHAFIEEKESVESGEQLIFMTFRTKKSDKKYTVLYKELNPIYREDLELNILETALWFDTGYKYDDNNLGSENLNIPTNIQNILSTFNNESIIPYQDTMSARNCRTIKTDSIFIRDFDLSCINRENETTQLFKFAYTNPYMMRSARDEEIIKFYIGDKYISNSYGQYTYEKSEIYDFIKIYNDVIDYFEYVLENPAFQNDDTYIFYKRFFISIIAIERALSKKIENIKDIDSFTSTDIKNFLVSYGMEKLSEILSMGSFLDSEDISKKLIQSYIPLVQNKGSRKVLDIIQEIFSVDKTTLTIYKTMLGKFNEGDIYNYSYNFIKSAHNEINEYMNLCNNFGKKIELEAFIEKDKYWNFENTKEDLLEKLGVDLEVSKYLIAEMKYEIAYYFYMLRCFFTIIDYILSSINNEKNNSIYIQESSVFDSNVVLRSYINSLRTAIETVIGGNSDLSDSYENRFLMNNNFIIEELTGFFKIDGNTYTLDEKKIKELFSTKSETKNVDIVKGIIEKLQPLVIIENEKLKGNKEQLLQTLKINIKGFNDISDIALIVRITTDILEIVDIVVGGLNNADTGNINKKLYDISWFTQPSLDFVEKIFNELFIVSTKRNDILLPVNDERETIPAKYENDTESFIVDGLSELSDFFGERLKYASASNDDILELFLQKTMEYFISHTVTLRNISYLREYNNLNETIKVRDNVFFTKTTTIVDSLYTDEQLSVEVQDKEE